MLRCCAPGWVSELEGEGTSGTKEVRSAVPNSTDEDRTGHWGQGWHVGAVGEEPFLWRGGENLMGLAQEAVEERN